MHFLRFLAAGFAFTTRHKKLVLVLWLVPLLPALILGSLAASNIAPELGHSLFADRVMDGDALLVFLEFRSSPADELTPIFGRGIVVMLAIDVMLFGILGVAVWAVQMIWIPFFAAGVINGLGHYWGYRNYQSPDAATNISPWGILIGGEELHNNHHAFPSSARLSSRWWEFDIGWMYIRLFELVRLARVRRVAREPQRDEAKGAIDMETVKAVVLHRMFVLANYARDVIKPVANAELCKTERECKRLARQARRLLVRDESLLDASSRQRLQKILERSQVLMTVHRSRQQLQQVWDRTASNQEALLNALQQWCREAEASGIQALEDFAHSLRTYRPALR